MLKQYLNQLVAVSAIAACALISAGCGGEDTASNDDDYSGSDEEDGSEFDDEDDDDEGMEDEEGDVAK
jgi:hypothetical protein